MNTNKTKQARLNAGLTQAQLAEKMGVNIRTVGKWEQGAREMSATAKILFEIVTKSKKT